MIARGCDEKQLRTAARETRVELYNLRRTGSGWGFTLRPSRAHTERRTVGGKVKMAAPYQRKSIERPWSGGGDRKVWAVCWHGHRDFFRALYRLNPNVVIRTAVAVYNNSAHFESVFPHTAYKNVGSQVLYVEMQDTCWCEELGEGMTLADVVAERMGAGAGEGNGK